MGEQELPGRPQVAAATEVAGEGLFFLLVEQGDAIDPLDINVQRACRDRQGSPESRKYKIRGSVIEKPLQKI